MARNTSVTIGDHFTVFIDEQVQAGRYGSASEVVRAGLRLLEEHETRVKALQAELITGERSGEPRMALQNPTPETCRLTEAEALLVEYVQKYGISEKARRYFAKWKESSHGSSWCH